jgi:hypothetical protein
MSILDDSTNREGCQEGFGRGGEGRRGRFR